MEKSKKNTKEFLKVTIEQLENEIAKELKTTPRFRIAFAIIMDSHDIPIKLWSFYSSKIGSRLNQRKQLKAKSNKGTP